MNLIVKQNTCITPHSKEKSIFYLTFSALDDSEGFNYLPGDWLTVQPQNTSLMVQALLAALNLQGDELLELRRAGLVTVKQALESHLELTQLNPAILNKLQRQLGLGDWSDRQAMMDYAYGRDILDLLELYPQLAKKGVEFLNYLSPLAPRYYSIASADAGKNEVSILYKAVEYLNLGRQRFGVASHFLQEAQPGLVVSGELKSNPTFKLPQEANIPIVMIGAGTGLAPFISFMQYRNLQKTNGEKIGEALLFFGETHQKTNCLFCEEIQEWQNQGLVEAFYVFSRDQAKKEYVTQRLLEQSEKLWTLIHNQAEIYICGSQTTLAVSVKEVFIQIFQQQGNMDEEEANAFCKTLRQTKRLQLDVY